MSPTPLATRQAVRAHAQQAEQQWEAAVNAFLPFPDRLRQLADAADGRARVLRLAELANIAWQGDDMSAVTLVPGLEPGAQRDGPPALWARYDEAVETLRVTLQSTVNRDIYNAYEAMCDILRQIAEDLAPTASEAPDVPAAPRARRRTAS
jgi:hypothetical protein